ncbi:10486_t:CDS:2, partial [Racocetra fulgida]
ECKKLITTMGDIKTFESNLSQQIIMPRHYKNTIAICINRRRRARNAFTLRGALDVAQNENRKRVQELEEMLEERKEQIVEMVQRNWLREEKH